ncbi:MAG: AI-2E family transporter [Proteobacteria bacterium]|nr:AI-2E family transporter [Pseudomonadota bacterium]
MTPKGTRAAFIVFFMALVAAFLYMASPLMIPAFVACIVSIIFYPLYQRLERLVRRRRYAAAGLATLLCFAVVLIPLAAMVGMLSVKLVGFAMRLAQQIQAGHLGQYIDGAGVAINERLALLPGGEELVVNLREMLIEGLKGIANFLYQYSPQVLSSTASIAVNLVLIAIFLVVFFAEGSRIFSWMLKILPISAVHQKEISREIRVMISALLFGMIGTAIVQGILMGVGFWAADFQNPAMWGMIAALVAFIPIIGAAFIYTGACIALVIMGRWEAAAAFLLYGLLIVSSVDNFLRPLVMRGRINVHPVLLFVALLGGIRAFGPIGAIFGPVLLAVFLASLRIYQREFTQS